MKRWKRILSTLLVCCLVVGLLPITTLAAGSDTDIAYAVTGGNIYFDTTTGTITDCDYYVSHADIPEEIEGIGVTNIGDSAFSQSFYLESVTIPDSVVNIGDYAFNECWRLTSIIIGDSVHNIGDFAFRSCSSLSNVTIPSSVISLGDLIFYGCNSLTEIEVIEENPAYCSVDGVLFNKLQTTLVQYPAQKEQNIYEVPSSVLNIEHYAFYNSNLITISIPNNVTSIGVASFADCSSLNNITLPNGLPCIENSTFSGCSSLTGVDIPESVTNIGNNAFSGCSSLCDIVIPSSVTSLGSHVFEDCTSLTSVIINSMVNSIADGDGYVYGGLFSGCTELKSAGPIGGDYNIQFGWTDSIPAKAFGSHDALESIVIPSGVTSIDNDAFYKCTNLTDVTIPDSVTAIGSHAFYGCTGLTSFFIPYNVTSIGQFAFYACDNLLDVYYSGSESDWAAITIEGGNTCLTNATIHYNSTGPDTPVVSGASVRFLSGWDETTRRVTFAEDGSPSLYTNIVADDVDVSNISELVNKYVLVTAEQGDSILEYTITDIQPVESAIGTVSATGEHSLTIDGTEYPVREDYILILSAYDGQEILYHIYDGTIVGITALEEKTGYLEDWDSTTGYIAISDSNGDNIYSFFTSYLTDPDILNGNLDWLIGSGIIIKYISTDGMVLHVVPDYTMSMQCPTAQVGERIDIEAMGNFTDNINLSENCVHWTVEDPSILTTIESSWDGTNPTISLRGNRIGTTTVTCSIDGVGEVSQEIRVGLDRWPFTNTNSATDWPTGCGYYISPLDSLRLNLKLSNIESVIISLKFLSQKWTGSCNGMSKWVSLVGAGVLSPELVNSESLHAVEGLSLGTQSAINYYHVQQFLFEELVQKNAFMSLSQTEQIEMLRMYAEDANNGGSPIFICFQWYNEFEEDGRCKTSDSSLKSHTVVGYGLETGNWTITVNDERMTYTHRVMIYDCSYNGKLTDTKHDLYFTDDGIWCIPGYNLISKDSGAGTRDNNGQFELVTNDMSAINIVDYATGNRSLAASANAIATLLVQSGALYSIINADNSYMISGFSVLESTGGESLNIIMEDNITADGESVPGTAAVVLPDADSSYTVTSGDSSINYSFAYENYMETAVMNSSGSIEFMPNGALSLNASEKTDYYVSITANDGYYTLPWYTIAATGSDSTNVSMELVDHGIILNGDNLNDVTVYGTNDEETKELTFSTDENSILITNKDNELIILADIDGDGEYETPIEEVSSKAAYTITFNANGGTVDIATMTTRTDGKLPSLPIPTRNGYTFDGWYTAASGGTQVTTSTVFNADATIYAHWTFIGSDSPSIPPSAPSNSSASYSVSVPSNVKNGIVTVNPQSASKGTTVTITATPDAGYKLSALTAADASGSKLALTDKGDGTYTFTMPASKVTVTVSFVEIKNEPEPVVNPFTDVFESDYYYDAVLWAVENKITLGTNADGTLFSPNAACDRGQMVTFLWRAAGCPEPKSSANPFTDVSESDYYYKAVLWAVENKITLGTNADGTLFSPNAACDRGQMAAFLWRAAGYPEPKSSVNPFTDVFESDYYYKAVLWAVENKITLGTNAGGTLFSPNAACDRGQMAAFLYRAYA